MYQERQPLGLIEMCTKRQPFIEDLDVRGPRHVSHSSADDEQNILSDMDTIFLHTGLLEVRAGILFKLFPDLVVGGPRLNTIYCQRLAFGESTVEVAVSSGLI